MLSSVIDLDRTPGTPRLDGDADPKWKTPRIEIFLVGAYYPTIRPNEWTFLGRLGGPVLLVSHARLFAFSRPGCLRAIEETTKLMERQCPTVYGVLTVRVLVTTLADGSVEMIEAWRLEGPHPRWVNYPFLPPSIHVLG
jgi:hypothetical protein